MSRKNADTPQRLSLLFQACNIPYEVYVVEYYNFFYKNLLKDNKLLCTCFDERQGILDTFVIDACSPLFSDFKFIEQVYQVEDLSHNAWSDDLRAWNMMNEDSLEIAGDMPSYLSYDFIDHVLKKKAPLRLSRRAYYALMMETHERVRKMPSLSIEDV